jgi:hypothetical protein
MEKRPMMSIAGATRAIVSGELKEIDRLDLLTLDAFPDALYGKHDEYTVDLADGAFPEEDLALVEKLLTDLAERGLDVDLEYD